MQRIVQFACAKILLCAILCLSLCLAGCEKESRPTKVGKLEYTIVSGSDVPQELKKLILERRKKPFELTYSENACLYVVRGYGKQKSGGYSITVDEFYEGETSLYIDTTLIGPKSAESVTNTVTYPYIVIKTENIEDKLIEFH